MASANDTTTEDAVIVSSASPITDRRVRVPPKKKDLYHLLRDILQSECLPNCLPADLAVECDSLIEVREVVENPSKGSVTVSDTGYGLMYCKRVKEAITEYRERDPLKLVAVGCSGSKINPDEPVPAQNLYDSTYWEKKQEYGSIIGDEWRIISAKHDVLHPEAKIGYYEKRASDLDGIPVESKETLPDGSAVTTLCDQWAANVHTQLQEWIQRAEGGIDPRDIELEILLGKSYKNRLAEREVFTSLKATGSLSISFPFQEVKAAQGGNGNQAQWMQQEVNAATHQTLGEMSQRAKSTS